MEDNVTNVNDKLDLYPDGGYVTFGFESYWRYGTVEISLFVQPHSIHGAIFNNRVNETNTRWYSSTFFIDKNERLK
jgi:hypothetical protein